MQNENKKIYGRAELKYFFKNGHIPTETHFANLIDSLINQSDDGISKNEKEGFVLTPMGTSTKLITFYKNIDRLNTFFFVEKDLQETPSLKFQSGSANNDPETLDNNAFFFHQNGQLGVGKRSNANHKLDVNGFAAAQGRIGTFKYGTVPANGKWHPIASNLDNCQAFEIVARVGKKGTGNFAMLHATALSAFGDSHSKIKKTCAYYGFFWNKLNIRWSGTTHNYKLELRTNRNYGNGIDIYYNLGKLWDDELFLPEECYYKQNNEIK